MICRAARRASAIGMVLALHMAVTPLRADSVRVATAANFAPTVEALAADFRRQTGHRLLISTGSTGKLYAQIVHGAPFDVLLAADADRPRRLERDGRLVAGTRFVYARGRLVLWSRDPGRVDDGGAVLAGDDFRRIAIANPRTAPYGAAARAVLERLGHWPRLSARVVQGEDIGQTFQFVATGNAELGFVAGAQLRRHERAGSSWVVPEDLYPPVDQEAGLLAGAAHGTAARRFLEFLRSDEARAIIARDGYSLP